MGNVSGPSDLWTVFLRRQMLLEPSEGMSGLVPSLLLQPGNGPGLEQGRRFRQTDAGPGKTSETWLKVWQHPDGRTKARTTGTKAHRPRGLKVLVGEQTQMGSRRTASFYER